MTDAHLHILSFNVPYPADYGGVVDVLAKIRALHAEGVQVHLHCFTYGRARAKALETCCASVHYYPRHMGLRSLSFQRPYIVQSRASAALVRALDQDNHPILAEGIHTSWPLMEDRWPGRSVAIRLHNVEALYYQGLASAESNPLRRLYALRESRLLAAWEAQVGSMNIRLLPIHPSISQYFINRYQSTDVHYCPAFTAYEAGGNLLDKGDYVLFHGDLSVADNQRSLEWLVEHVWSPDGPPWIVAGRQPSKRIYRLLQGRPGLQLEFNPSESRMDALIREAQVHLVHSFNTTGIKIKLLHALFRGRHCIAYAPLLAGTGLESTCHAASDAEGFREQLKRLWDLPFTTTDLGTRTRVLSAQFDNRANARKIKQWMGL